MLDIEKEELGTFKTLREMIRHFVLERGVNPAKFRLGDDGKAFYANATMIQDSVTKGDMRLMELVVALGVPIDLPVDEKGIGGNLPILPPGASALLVACLLLAMAESTHPEWVRARRLGMLRPAPSQELDRIAACAMQLVNLGADPNLTMPQGLGLGPEFRSLDPVKGKTAFQIAAMSKRRPLVALMWEHMQLSTEERAEIVHCRCGSRLPWKQCHLTGLGQPSQYMRMLETGDILYRVSPLARCPCGNTDNAYYECCWKDNRVPVYLQDKDGTLWSPNDDSPTPLSSFGRCLRTFTGQNPDAASTPGVPIQRRDRQNWRLKSRTTAGNPDDNVTTRIVELNEDPLSWTEVDMGLGRPVLVQPCVDFAGQDPSAASTMEESIRNDARRILEHPSLFAALCDEAGPQSRMKMWDPQVYVGCVERLADPFLWRDVHWDLDREVLLQRTDAWNDALLLYCNDVGLEGSERGRVLRTHTAYACGPCGYDGCSTFEREVREFKRCSRCKAIAYCGRKCQKKDWAAHKKVCQASPGTLPTAERNGPVNPAQGQSKSS